MVNRPQCIAATARTRHQELASKNRRIRVDSLKGRPLSVLTF